MNADKVVDLIGSEWAAQSKLDKKRLAILQAENQDLKEEIEGLKATLEEVENDDASDER